MLVTQHPKINLIRISLKMRLGLMAIKGTPINELVKYGIENKDYERHYI